MRVHVCVSVYTFVCLLLTMFPVLAEAERAVQKCDRSAVNKSGMRKVEKFSFCLVTILLILVNHETLGPIKQLVQFSLRCLCTSSV